MTRHLFVGNRKGLSRIILEPHARETVKGCTDIYLVPFQGELARSA